MAKVKEWCPHVQGWFSEGRFCTRRDCVCRTAVADKEKISKPLDKKG